MTQFATPGDFCPHTACPDYGKVQDAASQRNMRKFGHTARGIQRYQCRTCQRTFTATTGTIFFGKRTPNHRILEVLALLAEGNRISSLTRVTGIKEDTILAWLREAAHHAAQIEAVLLADFKVTRAQIDALWAYVGNKGEKKLSGNG